VQAGEERFQLAAGIKAIDPAGALATLRGLHENKLPAKAGKQPAKP